MAKSLAGGLPLSAVIGRAEIMDAPAPGGLGGTYAGNPLGVRRGARGARRDRGGAAVRARRRARRQALKARLQSAAQRSSRGIADVRGLGAMVAIELAQGRHRRCPTPMRRRRVQTARAGRGPAAADLRRLRQRDPLPVSADHQRRAVRRGAGHPRAERPAQPLNARETRHAHSSKTPACCASNAIIDGQWVDADDGATMDVNNPATGELDRHRAEMGARRDRAAPSTRPTRRCLPGARRTAKERAAILRKWFDLMMANQDDLALHHDHRAGQAAGRIARARSPTPPRSSSGSPRKASASTATSIPAHQADKRIVVIKQPIGVCAAITPWNFPAAMITRKAGPALAAGCTMVVKPATQTPFSALALAELARARRHPQGRASTSSPAPPATIGAETDRATRSCASSPSPARPRSASMLMEQCAGTVKKVSLELGGNAPFIVFDDADLDARGRGRDRSPSTATPARPASAPTASSCRTASTTRSPQKLVDGGRAR